MLRIEIVHRDLREKRRIVLARQSGNSLMVKLEYRDYRDEDDEACKGLEMRAMQGGRFPALQKILKLLFRGGFEHNVAESGRQAERSC